MTFRSNIAYLIALATKFIIIYFKKGKAESAPGLIAQTIDPEFITNFHKKFSTKILITGTNGKTTTSNLISSLFKKAKIKFINNSAGSNLERGIASALLKKSEDINTAIWETDEAAFINIAKKINPTHIIITNLFRDQLDRYGEINSIFNKWHKCLKTLHKLELVLNADDPSLALLGAKLKKYHNVTYFGIKSYKTFQKNSHAADSIFCPFCHKKLHFKNIYYSHLGNYHCSCSFKKPHLNISASKIENKTNKTLFSIQKYNFQTQLLGIYNIYNFLAAFSLSSLFNISQKTIKNVFSNFSPVKGRQEIINLKDKNVHFWLVKNPTGYNQVIETLSLFHKNLTLCLALNDNIADGTDVSWIWDVNFEKLKSFTRKIILTGNRVYDLALRLKYADFDQNKIILEKSSVNAIKTLLKQKDKNLYILPTYTALWKLRDLLLTKK